MLNISLQNLSCPIYIYVFDNYYTYNNRDKIADYDIKGSNAHDSNWLKEG
jgi:hypothetical protein